MKYRILLKMVTVETIGWNVEAKDPDEAQCRALTEADRAHVPCVQPGWQPASHSVSVEGVETP
jgi:hypothetical protein